MEILVPIIRCSTSRTGSFPRIGPAGVRSALYFLGERDQRYVSLLRMKDSFPNNPGDKTGSLVEARHGKGALCRPGSLATVAPAPTARIS